MPRQLLRLTETGITCESGGFVIVPHLPHAKLIREGTLEEHPIGEPFTLGETTVSLLRHGTVRVEHEGHVELAIDATFGLPIYRWDPPELVAREVLAWWDQARLEDAACVILAPSPGAPERLRAELAKWTDRSVLLDAETPRKGELLLVAGEKPAPWKKARVALLSGTARVRGVRRRRSFDRGFVFEERADWPTLLRMVEESGAKRVIATGTYGHVFARFLREERGLDA